MPAQNKNGTLAVYLGIVQFFGGWILGFTVLSGAAFLALPYASGNAGILLGAILVWSVTSSALRSPPWALLAQHAAAPSVPLLSTLVLTGSAVAAALAPYLGIALKGADPRLPFALSTLTLVATVGGLVYAERRLAAGSAPAQNPAEEKKPPPDAGPVALFFVALLLMAAGFQVHFALNSAPRYLAFATPERLPYLMPVFWIGFNIVMFPASSLVKRLGPLKTLAGAALLGVAAILGSVLARDLPGLVLAQFMAGGLWGAASVAAYTAAIGFGRIGREGRMLGTLFAVLALAAFVRIAAYASDLVVQPELKALLPWIPEVAWLLSAALLFLAAFSRDTRASRRG